MEYKKIKLGAGFTLLETTEQLKGSKMFLTGFTLIELLVALTLVGMTIAAVVAIDVSGRRFLTSSEYEARVQNEISPILERIVKDATLGIGDNVPGGSRVGIVVPSARRVEIRHLDTDSVHSSTMSHTYGDYADDRWVAYEWNGTTRSIFFQRGSPGSWGQAVTLAQNITDCIFNLSSSYVLSISATARRDATPGSTVYPNPEIRLDTEAFPRHHSIP